MKLKKLLSMFLCASMVFALGACGDSTDQNESTPAEQQSTKDEAPADDTVADPFEGVDLTKTLVLALNVMYNDADSAYYGNEVGPTIQVSGDGQYTLTFDCATNLSDASKSAGVKSLKYLTSIYIKDYATTAGKLGASNVVSCDIKYDKIVVDGVELTINQTEPKAAVKANGIFDTNDPINFWDGSAVDEVDYYDEAAHSGILTCGDNPKKIEVTFTLSNLVWAD